MQHIQIIDSQHSISFPSFSFPEPSIVEKEQGYLRTMWDAVKHLHQRRKQRALKAEMEREEESDAEHLSSTPQDLLMLDAGLHESPRQPASSAPLSADMVCWLDRLIAWSRDVDDSVVVCCLFPLAPRRSPSPPSTTSRRTRAAPSISPHTPAIAFSLFWRTATPRPRWRGGARWHSWWRR